MVAQSNLCRLLMTPLRDAATQPAAFKRHADRIARLVLAEAINQIPSKSVALSCRSSLLAARRQQCQKRMKGVRSTEREVCRKERAYLKDGDGVSRKAGKRSKAKKGRGSLCLSVSHSLSGSDLESSFASLSTISPTVLALLHFFNAPAFWFWVYPCKTCKLTLSKRMLSVLSTLYLSFHLKRGMLSVLYLSFAFGRASIPVSLQSKRPHVVCLVRTVSLFRCHYAFSQCSDSFHLFLSSRCTPPPSWLALTLPLAISEWVSMATRMMENEGPGQELSLEDRPEDAKPGSNGRCDVPTHTNYCCIAPYQT